MSNANSWLDFAQRPREEGGLGLAKHQAAGVVGNLVNESGPDIPAWGPSGDNGTAWGSAQWRGDRLTGLQRHASENGLDYKTPEAQQAWMRREFDTTENRAYKALMAATTPEEAARAFDQHYERSDGATRDKRAASARQFYGGAPVDGPTAIDQAMGRTGSRMNSYADENAGGALRPQQAPGALNTMGYQPAQPTWLETLGQTLKDMAPGIAQDPDNKNALIKAAESGRKVAGAQGTWSTHIDPKTGLATQTHSLTGQMRQYQAQPPQPEKNKQAEAYEGATGKAFSEKNQKIQDDAVSSAAALSNIDTLRSALSNPEVYQGTGGDQIAALKKLGNSTLGMDFKGVADADVATSLINKLTQESRQLNGGMPGSLSDKDLAFLKSANAGLDKTPEANQRILDIYAKLHTRNIEMNKERLAYTQGGRQLDEGFNQRLSSKWAAENAADNAAFKAEQAASKASPAAAPSKAPQLPKGVKSIQLIQ